MIDRSARTTGARSASRSNVRHSSARGDDRTTPTPTSSTTSRSGSSRTRRSARRTRIATKLLFTGGLRITTTLDPRLQALRRAAVRSSPALSGRPRRGADGRSTRAPATSARWWAARTRLLVRDADAGRVNLATGAAARGARRARRSSRSRWSPPSRTGSPRRTVFSAPATIDIPEPTAPIWHVTNAEGSGYGSMTLESAT